MKFKNYFIIVFAGLLFGCSSYSKKLQTSFNPDTEGMIVGSICIENKVYKEYKFMYGETIAAFNDIPNNINEFEITNEKPDYTEKGKSYYLFTIVKPANDYKFFKLKITNSTRINHNFIEIPIYFPFKIEKGKTTYFGQLIINTKDKEYTVENQIDRDRELFTKKRPEIKF